MDENQYYNKEDIYDKQIAPIIKELKTVCNYNHMPMFTTVAVANSPTDTEYRSEIIYASTEVKLAKKNLPKLLLLLNEFDTELPQKVRHSIGIIEEYCASRNINPYTSSHNDSDVSNVQLQTDLIEKMDGVLNGDDAIIIPDGNI